MKIYDKYEVGQAPGDFATQPDLKAMKPLGHGISGVGYKNGVDELAKTKSADMTNSSSTLNITASNENLSAKFKYPQAHQDTGIMYTGQK
jgi:hypothetical protein